MIDAKFFTKEKSILVVGAGRSGMAALRLLAKQGCQLSISDGGPLAKLSTEDQQWLKEQKVLLEFSGHDVYTFLKADCIVMSPGVPLDAPELLAAEDKGIPIIGELELGALFTDTKIIAVTGTNGKTTVTTMIGEFLAADGRDVFVGGNIGTPLCEFVAGDDQAEALVLEVSSFQLDTAVSFHPHVAVLLNVSPDHLDRYGSYEEYIDSKMSIFSRQRRDDFAVINGDDHEIKKRLGGIPSTIRGFGSKKSSYARLVGNKALVHLCQDSGEQYQLPGPLNKYPNSDNCLAAIIAARLMGCSAKAVVKGLAQFKCLDHRLTEVGTVNGVLYVDDSKATNVGAVKSALSGMARPVHLIAGGRDKGGDYGLLAEEIGTKVKSLIVIGEAADKIAAAFAGLTEIFRAKSMDEAVALAACEAQPGEVILLSPACASFDMFSSYGERGDAFQRSVRELRQEKTGNALSSSGKRPLRRAV
ncbi:MAG: UDP-N-acetylmuramoyl-L-alanine--D-glutamate ligase [Thermodesulfobacteriota bacterium]